MTESMQYNHTFAYIRFELENRKATETTSHNKPKHSLTTETRYVDSKTSKICQMETIAVCYNLFKVHHEKRYRNRCTAVLETKFSTIIRYFDQYTSKSKNNQDHVSLTDSEIHLQGGLATIPVINNTKNNAKTNKISCKYTFS